MFDVSTLRYVKKDSVVHRLDPRVKFLFLLVYTASLFYLDSFPSLLFSAVFLLFLYIISKVPPSYALKSIWRITMLFLVFGIIITVTEEDGEKRALLMITRLILTVSSSILLNATTKPGKIAEGIEKALGKGRLRKPARIFSIIVMISLRFLPLLKSEAERIMDAQKSRGCSFEEKGIINKARAVIPILVPVFVSAFHRADELAVSMDARGFNKERSTSLHPLKYSMRDFFAYFLTALYLLVSVMLEKMKWI